METLDLRTCLSSSRAIELLSEVVDDVLGPEETFEAGVEIHFASIARGLFDENKSDFGAFDLGDTCSDDVVRGILEIDENEHEYDEYERNYR